MDKYSGADWIEKSLKQELSPLGREVADILGQVWRGIYHLEKQIRKVDWANTFWITINIYGDLSTYDFSRLTELVVLCHDRMLRLEISPCNFRYLTLIFHQRMNRDGMIGERMPTMEDHIQAIREHLGLEIL